MIARRGSAACGRVCPTGSELKSSDQKIPSYTTPRDASLLATPHISPSVLLTLAIYLLLKQGLSAATHPKCTRIKAFRNLLIAVASVVCLIAAAGLLQLMLHE